LYTKNKYGKKNFTGIARHRNDLLCNYYLRSPLHANNTAKFTIRKAATGRCNIAVNLRFSEKDVFYAVRRQSTVVEYYVIDDVIDNDDTDAAYSFMIRCHGMHCTHIS